MGAAKQIESFGEELHAQVADAQQGLQEAFPRTSTPCRLFNILWARRNERFTVPELQELLDLKRLAVQQGINQRIIPFLANAGYPFTIQREKTPPQNVVYYQFGFKETESIEEPEKPSYTNGAINRFIEGEDAVSDVRLAVLEYLRKKPVGVDALEVAEALSLDPEEVERELLSLELRTHEVQSENDFMLVRGEVHKTRGQLFNLLVLDEDILHFVHHDLAANNLWRTRGIVRVLAYREAVGDQQPASAFDMCNAMGLEPTRVNKDLARDKSCNNLVSRLSIPEIRSAVRFWIERIEENQRDVGFKLVKERGEEQEDEKHRKVNVWEMDNFDLTKRGKALGETDKYEAKVQKVERVVHKKTGVEVQVYSGIPKGSDDLICGASYVLSGSPAHTDLLNSVYAAARKGNASAIWPIRVVHDIPSQDTIFEDVERFTIANAVELGFAIVNVGGGMYTILFLDPVARAEALEKKYPKKETREQFEVSPLVPYTHTGVEKRLVCMKQMKGESEADVFLDEEEMTFIQAVSLAYSEGNALKKQDIHAQLGYGAGRLKKIIKSINQKSGVTGLHVCQRYNGSYRVLMLENMEFFGEFVVPPMVKRGVSGRKDMLGRLADEAGTVPMITDKLKQLDIGRRIEEASHRPAYQQYLRERWCEASLKLVFKEVYSHAGKGELGDLAQEGSIALIRAIENFDYSLCNKLSSIACIIIEGAVKRSMYNTTRTVRVPIHRWELLAKVEKIIHEVRNVHDRNPTIEEIAEKAGVTVADAIFLMKNFQPEKSLNAKRSEGGASEFMDTIPNRRCTPEEALCEKDEREKMWVEAMKRMENLTERQKRVVMLRTGMETGQGESFTKIGELLGLSHTSAANIMRAALEIIADKPSSTEKGRASEEKMKDQEASELSLVCDIDFDAAINELVPLAS